MENNTLNRLLIDQVDDATATLLVQLQQEDLEELQRSNTGKCRENEVSDTDFAINIIQKELKQMRLTLADRRMSRSLTQAISIDSALLTDIVALEEVAVLDRVVAQRLHDGNETTSGQETNLGNEVLDDLTIARLNALYVSGIDGESTSLAILGEEEKDEVESSAFAARRTNPLGISRHECVSCGEHKRFFELFRAPCERQYCQDCLSNLFELSTTDETVFPPRCCRQEVPFASARLYLSGELHQRFLQKRIEFQTADRTYCSQPGCSTFIPPADITGEDATCPVCSTET